MSRKPRFDLEKMVEDARFISGIYNYCDRWCERCPLTSRCLTYASEQAEEDENSESRDLTNEKFWNKLQDVFQQTREMIEGMAQEQGIDLAAPAEVNNPELERRQRRALAKHTPIVKSGDAYAKMVEAWFKAESELIESEGEHLITQAKLGIGNPRQDAAELKDIVDVIRWYQFFICVKLQRALGSRANEDTSPRNADWPRDSDGSAKISLIAIDRSIQAWVAMRERFKDRTDSILELLVQLARLRAEAEKLFPNARKFIRPGFDTGDKPMDEVPW